MIRIDEIKLPVDMEHEEDELSAAAAAKLHCPQREILHWRILKKSLDARKKPKLFWSWGLLWLGMRLVISRRKAAPRFAENRISTIRSQKTNIVASMLLWL